MALPAMQPVAQFPSLTMNRDLEGQVSIFDLPSDHLLAQPALPLAPVDPAAPALFPIYSLAAHDYDVDVRTAFLPPDQPHARLPPPFEAWEDAWDASRDVAIRDEGVDAARWRLRVETMPVIDDLSPLTTITHLRRAHVVLTFLLHRYTHSLPAPSVPTVTPASIGVPLADVSRKLDLPPVLTYADTVLWNWRLRRPEDGFTIENLEVISSFTGSASERHFYAISALTEMLGAPAMRLMSAVLDEAFLNDRLARIRITQHLTSLVPHIDAITAAMAATRDACRPSAFYHEIRPWFVSGPRVIDGELYDLGGPSAGQSSLIHALDLFLGIEHLPMQDDTDSAETTFMQRMLAYMPSAHRSFLRHLSTEALPVRQLALEEGGMANPALKRAYDGCIDAVRRLREEHMRIVNEYIIRFARLERRRRVGGDDDDEAEARGTGGTNAMDLLRRTRAATLRARLVAPA